MTGAGGFVGRNLIAFLASRGFSVIAASRTALAPGHPNIVTAPLSDLALPFDWRALLERCDAIVHLAGVAHRFSGDEQYNLVNYRATEALAKAACRQQKHLIFVSSIAAQSGPFSEQELTEEAPPRPANAYGRSKLAAEHAVRASGACFTILRPVVIYGQGEKGNVSIIHRVSNLPIPLPFGAVTARRSVLSIDNFCSAIVTVLTDPRAHGETFIVSDPTPVTVSDLISRHRAASGRSPWLVPVPERWIELSFAAFGLGDTWNRVGKPLVARPTKLLALGWKPS
ncbi:NAD-dependent epimerase/dehydratase family protein [Bradyrhizobium sp. BWA-3-5]|uniref:NAD-dependent epimerase/dehydratase family protein n=1 Tax=Bradyrhizobium sp. BWA-3-5 TaxID=3080013 RepID=UPI00293EAB41|nr:NAD-dependent epimerase/dehydratase family protein [Bradyrhizobium sp. BWA-3-5]WOH68202.1 NAD-dependent epimerase/dehydratase family protein [Bradyrhizobium sp. BWA-3-5]